MSTLQVANIWFESTGNNRIQYIASNTAYAFAAGGANVMTVNTSTVIFSPGGANVMVVNTTAVSFPQTFTYTGTVNFAQANVASQTLTDGATINWDTSQGPIATVTLGGNRTFANAINIKVGTYILHVLQDGTGSRTLTWGSMYKWPGGVAPTLTTTASARDVISFVSDGTNFYGTYVNNVK